MSSKSVNLDKALNAYMYAESLVRVASFVESSELEPESAAILKTAVDDAIRARNALYYIVYCVENTKSTAQHG